LENCGSKTGIRAPILGFIMMEILLLICLYWSSRLLTRLTGDDLQTPTVMEYLVAI
jgi:hypothetical protein